MRPCMGEGAQPTGRFALGIENGREHFECLMPKLMTVEATVTNGAVSGASASLQGTASVTLATGNPLGLPARDVPFTATATAGGPGVGQLDLKVLGMDFPGTVERGQITVSP